MLVGFAVLVARGVLYTLSDHPAWLLGVQLLDGIGAGIFGALFPVVIASIMRGTGRFNGAQGAAATVQGLGGALSTTLAGAIIVAGGYDAAFVTLAVIGAAGLLLYWACHARDRAPGLIHCALVARRSQPARVVTGAAPLQRDGRADQKRVGDLGGDGLRAVPRDQRGRTGGA